MGAIEGIKAVIYAAVFASGLGAASFVLMPRINMWEAKYNEQVTLNSSLQSSVDEQNAKVFAFGEESKRMIEGSKNALDAAKKDNAVHEHKVISLMSSKSPTLDLCKDASQLIDKEFMQ
jgi:hypothetical protein